MIRTQDFVMVTRGFTLETDMKKGVPNVRKDAIVLTPKVSCIIHESRRFKFISDFYFALFTSQEIETDEACGQEVPFN